MFDLIGAAARKAGVSVCTARQYCRLGLIDPVLDSAGRRLFTAADVQRIQEIRQEKASKKWEPGSFKKMPNKIESLDPCVEE